MHTFRNISSGDRYTYVFQTIFSKDLKNVKVIKIGPCPLACKLFLALLLDFAEQDSLTKFAIREGSSDQKIKKGTFVRVEKLSF